MVPRVLLLVPPGWNYLWQPHLCLPSLAAYLREHGCQVCQQDLNMDFFEALTDQATVAGLHQRMVAAFRMLDESDRLDLQQQRRYADLAWAACQSPQAWVGNLQQAMTALRNPASYFHIPTCSRQSALLHQVWNMVWATFDQGQPENRVETLIELLAEAHNPFLPFLQEKLASLLAFHPHLVVLSVYYSRQLPAALTLGQLFKRADENLHITLEGRVPTALGSSWLQHPALFSYLDSVVVGQSERPLLALAYSRAAGEPFDQIPSLIYREEGTVLANARGECERVDALPPPDFLPLERYLIPHSVLPLQAARGCYWGRCRFCPYKGERDFEVYEPHSAQWLGETIERLAIKYATPYFTFADECVSPDLLEQVAEEILRRSLKIWWQAQTRPEAGLTLERCRRLAQSGCVALQFCFETASDVLSERVEMGLSQAERKTALTNCAQAGILTHAFIVLGLPGERKEEANQTAAFVLENQNVIHGLSIEPYVLGKCTPLARAPTDGLQWTAPAADDLALNLTHWESDGGMSQAQVQECCQTLRQAVRRQFPAFAASHFPALLYAVHYHCRDPRELFQHSQRLDLARDSGSKGWLPRCRPEVVSGTFRFDLPAIKRCREGNEGTEVLKPVDRPITCFLDGPSGAVVTVSAPAAYVLAMADGNRGPGAIAKLMAERFELSEQDAQKRSRASLQLYRAFLE